MLYVCSPKINVACPEQDLHFIEFDHQHTFFGRQLKIFSLKNLNIQACSDFVVKSFEECASNNIEQQWYTNGTNSVVIASDNLISSNHLLILKLTAVDNEGLPSSCLRLLLHFQVHPEGSLFYKEHLT